MEKIARKITTSKANDIMHPIIPPISSVSAEEILLFINTVYLMTPDQSEQGTKDKEPLDDLSEIDDCFAYIEAIITQEIT